MKPCKHIRMSKIFGGYALGSRGLFAFASVVATLLVASAHAQVGNDNPTGPSGEFGDVVTTGCSYSAYPANAFRSITDIMVAGSVGQYPLAFTRTMTSRYIAGVGTEFGAAARRRGRAGAGGWSPTPIGSSDPSRAPTPARGAQRCRCWSRPRSRSRHATDPPAPRSSPTRAAPARSRRR